MKDKKVSFRVRGENFDTTGIFVEAVGNFFLLKEASTKRKEPNRPVFDDLMGDILVPLTNIKGVVKILK